MHSQTALKLYTGCWLVRLKSKLQCMSQQSTSACCSTADLAVGFKGAMPLVMSQAGPVPGACRKGCAC